MQVTSSFVGIRMASPHLHQGGGGSIPGGGSNTEHQLRMRRPSKIKCQLGIAKHSHAFTAIKWACDRLGVEVAGTLTMTSEAILNGWTVGKSVF